MMIAAELLHQLNELDEHDTIEAKRSSQAGRSVLETICAYSNEPGIGGGHIILGVKCAENTFWPSYEVEGIDDTGRVQSEIATQCTSVFNRPIRPRISVEALGSKKVVVLYVQEVSPSEKPVYFVKEGLPRGAYRRIGSTDHRCTDDDMLLFAQDRQSGT